MELHVQTRLLWNDDHTDVTIKLHYNKEIHFGYEKSMVVFLIIVLLFVSLRNQTNQATRNIFLIKKALLKFLGRASCPRIQCHNYIWIEVQCNALC